MPGMLLSTASSFSWATDAMGNLMSMVTTMLGAIKDEPTLAVYYVAGFATIAISVLGALKHA